MNTELTLVMLATGGTAALVGAAFLFGFNKSEVISTEAAAADLIRNFAPGQEPKAIVLSDDKRSALIVTTQEIVFYCTQMGDGPVVRELNAGDLQQKSNDQALIDVRDFGFPKRIFSGNIGALQPVFDALTQGTRL